MNRNATRHIHRASCAVLAQAVESGAITTAASAPPILTDIVKRDGRVAPFFSIAFTSTPLCKRRFAQYK
jgi:hypothetical protein